MKVNDDAVEEPLAWGITPHDRKTAVNETKRLCMEECPLPVTMERMAGITKGLQQLERAYRVMDERLRPLIDAFAHMQPKPICEHCNVNEQRGRGLEPELCEECQNEHFTVVAVLLLCWMAWLGAFTVTVLS